MLEGSERLDEAMSPNHYAKLELLGQLGCKCASLFLLIQLTFLKMEKPEFYSAHTKPNELNLFSSIARKPAAAAANTAGQYPNPNSQPQMPFPYGCYPPPFVWGAPQMYPGAMNPTPHVKPVNVIYPKIEDWLKHCDARHGENFSAHTWRFLQEGYRDMEQLTSRRMSIEKLSEWLNIGKGLADLLIRYADEDVKLVEAGLFQMESIDDA
jgi:hypothetical protein